MGVLDEYARQMMDLQRQAYDLGAGLQLSRGLSQGAAQGQVGAATPPAKEVSDELLLLLED